MATTRGEVLLARARFASLTRPDGRTGRVKPGLASSWASNPDSTRFEFVLGEALTASDGSPITSEVVVASLNRLAGKNLASPNAFLLEHVVGFEAVNVTGTARVLAGIKAQGPRKIIIELQRSFSELPVWLAHAAAGVVVKGVGAEAPSTGPFVAESLTPNRAASLVKNPRFAPATALLERFEILIVENGPRALRARTVDAAFVPPGETSEVRAPLWVTLSVGVNLASLGDLKARAAIEDALDRGALAEAVDGTPATSLVPPGVLVGEIPSKAVGADAWKKSQHPDALRLVHLDDAQSKTLMQEVQAQLAAKGIPSTLEPVEPGAYATKLSSKDFDLIQLGWLSLVPSPDGFLAGQLKTGSVDNKMGWSDEAFDGFIERARRAKNPKARDELYFEAAKRAAGQLPQIPLVHLDSRLATMGPVNDIGLDGSGTFDPAIVWIGREAA